MKPQSLLKIGTGAAVLLGLASAYYYGQSPHPYQFTQVQFCPETANSHPKNQLMKYYKAPAEAQERLDTKYCRFKYRLLTEVWRDRQFNDFAPYPKNPSL